MDTINGEIRTDCIGYKDFNFYPDYYPEETYDEEPEPELEEFEDGGEEDEDE